MERAQLKSLVLATGCTEQRGEFVFLRDPNWGPAEQSRLAAAVQTPGVACGDQLGWLCVPTGGTSGGLRFARHDERTLGAAVRSFCAHFGVSRVNALDVLPAYHVSGLLARIRCAETGGTHLGWSWKQLEAGEWPAMPESDHGWFLSLVPTQLQRLLTSNAAIARLKQFRAVFLGGGPLWPALADAAAAAQVPVSICFGMTETAAMVAAQRPGEFLAGDRSCGTIMPHVRVDLLDEVSGEILPLLSTGRVRISGESGFRGYWPEANDHQSLLTEDLGQIDAQGRLYLLGRRDAVIITGGEKVSPLEVEAVLRATDEFDDIAVIGLPDARWGDVVVACYPPRAAKLDTQKIMAALETLAPYKRPKLYLTISPWPRNDQGKLNRAALAKAAAGDSSGLPSGSRVGRIILNPPVGPESEAAD
jgi:O-succinylbenzoic acid--CoA ligase